jgi:hypothetical protein
LRARAAARPLEPSSVGEKILIVVLAAGLFLGFAADGAPPLAHDALAYHLALPKLFWREGRLTFFPWNNASAWPHLLHFLYLPGVAFGVPQTAQFIHGF